MGTIGWALTSETFDCTTPCLRGRSTRSGTTAATEQRARGGAPRMLPVIDSSPMPDETTPTAEQALDALIEAVGKAAADYQAVGRALTRARDDIAARNTALSRTLVSDATRALDHLRGADQALKGVLTALEERD